MQLDEPRAYHGALRDVAVRQVSQLAGKEAHEGLAIGGFLDAQDDFFKGNVGLCVPVSTASESREREQPTLWCEALSQCGGGAQAGCELEFLEAVVVVCLRTQDGHAVLRDAGVSEGNIIPADG